MVARSRLRAASSVTGEPEVSCQCPAFDRDSAGCQRGCGQHGAGPARGRRARARLLSLGWPVFRPVAGPGQGSPSARCQCQWARGPRQLECGSTSAGARWLGGALTRTRMPLSLLRWKLGRGSPDPRAESAWVAPWAKIPPGEAPSRQRSPSHSGFAAGSQVESQPSLAPAASPCTFPRRSLGRMSEPTVSPRVRACLRVSGKPRRSAF